SFSVSPTAPLLTSPMNVLPSVTPAASTFVTNLTPKISGYSMPPRPAPTTASNDPGVDGAVTITGRATHFIVTGPGSTVAGNPLVVQVIAEDVFNNIASN